MLPCNSISVPTLLDGNETPTEAEVKERIRSDIKSSGVIELAMGFPVAFVLLFYIKRLGGLLKG